MNPLKVAGAAVVKDVTSSSDNVGALIPGQAYLVVATALCWLNWGTHLVDGDPVDNDAVSGEGLMVPATYPLHLVFGNVGDAAGTLRVQAITGTTATLTFVPVCEP